MPYLLIQANGHIRRRCQGTEGRRDVWRVMKLALLSIPEAFQHTPHPLDEVQQTCKEDPSHHISERHQVVRGCATSGGNRAHPTKPSVAVLRHY